MTGLEGCAEWESVYKSAEAGQFLDPPAQLSQIHLEPFVASETLAEFLDRREHRQGMSKFLETSSTVFKKTNQIG